MFKAAYCEHFHLRDLQYIKDVCKEFIVAVKEFDSNLLLKPKFHLLLHLSECMRDFGPTSAYSAERYFILHTCTVKTNVINFVLQWINYADVKPSIPSFVSTIFMEIGKHQVETLPSVLEK